MSTQPIEAHHIKKGGYVLLKGFPCKIVEVKTSKTGKHGHAKCNITGTDVFTNRKYNEVAPGHLIFNGFEFKKTEYDLLSVDWEDNHAELLDPTTSNTKTITINPEAEPIIALKKDMTPPEDDAGAEEKYFTVTVGIAPLMVKDTAVDSEAIIAHAENKD